MYKSIGILFWSCIVIKQFRVEIHKNTETIFALSTLFKLTIFILGNTESLPDSTKYVFEILITACKKKKNNGHHALAPPLLFYHYFNKKNKGMLEYSVIVILHFL